METIIVPIVVAILIGPIVALIQKGRKENKIDHGGVMNAIDKIDKKLDGHIDWHLKK